MQNKLRNGLLFIPYLGIGFFGGAIIALIAPAVGFIVSGTISSGDGISFETLLFGVMYALIPAIITVPSGILLGLVISATAATIRLFISHLRPFLQVIILILVTSGLTLLVLIPTLGLIENVTDIFRFTTILVVTLGANAFVMLSDLAWRWWKSQLR